MNRQDCEALFAEWFDKHQSTPLVYPRFEIWKLLCGNSANSPDSTLVNRFINESMACIQIKLTCWYLINNSHSNPLQITLMDVLTGEWFRRIGLVNLFEEDVYSWVLNPELSELIDDYCGILKAELQSNGLISAFQYMLNNEFINTNFNMYASDQGRGSLDPRPQEFILVQDPNAVHKVKVLFSVAKEKSTYRDSEKMMWVLGCTATIGDSPLTNMLLKCLYLDEILSPNCFGDSWYMIPVYQQFNRVLDSSQQTAQWINMFVSDIRGLDLNAFYLDWMLYRMEQYVNGAARRMHNTRDKDVVEDVCGAFYDYLISKKPRTPVPEKVSIKDANVLVNILRGLITQNKPEIGLIILQGFRTLFTGLITREEQWDRVI